MTVHYFASYIGRKQGEQGIGDATFGTDNPITTADDLNVARSAVQKAAGYDEGSIIFLSLTQLARTPD